MTEPLHPLAGLSGSDRTRAQASLDNARNILLARRRLAAALVAPPAPYAALQARWSAVLHPDLAKPVEEWGPFVGGDLNAYTGTGPPPDPFPFQVKVGDLYRDDTTGTVYRLEATE